MNYWRFVCHPLLLAFISFTTSFPLETTPQQTHELPVKLLYEYPKGTWIENIAVRPSGELLLTILTKPELDQLDPFQSSPKPVTIRSIPGLDGLSGVAEIAPDSFAFAAGNISFTSGGMLGSWSIWNVDFSATKVDFKFRKIADVPTAKFLNGMCTLPSTKEPLDILVGDIEEGVVRRIDTTTGAADVTINNTFTAAGTDPIFGVSGVNGILVHQSNIYFTNTHEKIFARVSIESISGKANAKTEILFQVDKSEYAFYFDDFAIQDGYAYIVTGSGDSVERIGLDGIPKAETIAGRLNSTEIAEPTSAAFGRTEQDRHVLYVVTAGNFLTGKEIGGQVLAIDTSGLKA